jgi:hypothetical protein
MRWELLNYRGNGRFAETEKVRDVAIRQLVAGDHVLRNALRADDCVGRQRKTPQLATVFAEIPGRGNSTDAYHRCDGVSANDRGMCSVKIR